MSYRLQLLYFKYWPYFYACINFLEVTSRLNTPKKKSLEIWLPIALIATLVIVIGVVWHVSSKEKTPVQRKV